MELKESVDRIKTIRRWIGNKFSDKDALAIDVLLENAELVDKIGGIVPPYITSCKCYECQNVNNFREKCIAAFAGCVLSEDEIKSIFLIWQNTDHYLCVGKLTTYLPEDNYDEASKAIRALQLQKIGVKE